MSFAGEPGVRPKPEDAAGQVAALPRRVAHAAHACLVACEGGGPSTPSEIMIYDGEAPSLSATCSALLRAVREHGLCDRWARGVYVPTLRAHDLRDELEDRYLRETEELGSAA